MGIAELAMQLQRSAKNCYKPVTRYAVDAENVQNYLMSWLHESAADSEQLHLLFPQSDGNSLSCAEYDIYCTCGWTNNSADLKAAFPW